MIAQQPKYSLHTHHACMADYDSLWSDDRTETSLALDLFGVGKETAFEALVGSTPSGIY